MRYSAAIGNKKIGIWLQILVVGSLLMISGYVAATFNQEESTQGWQSFIALGAGAAVLFLAGSTKVHQLQLYGYFQRQLMRLSGTSVDSSIDEISSFEGVLPRDRVLNGWNNLVRIARNQLIENKLDRREGLAVRNPLHDHVVRSLRSLPEGIAISDQQGKLVYCNPTWNLLCGRTIEAEGEPSTILESLSLSRFANAAQSSRDILSGSGPRTVKLHISNDVADGVLQLTRTPLDGRLHDSEGFVWMLRDVTQQSLAAQAHEQFLSSATHELRTPITNIRAYAESLTDIEDISVADQREFFNVITSEALRLNKLLDDLLNLQQLQAGSMTLTLANFDCMRMLGEVADRMSPLATEKNLKLVSRIAPNLKPIYADKEKLTACFVNLIGNAIKYTLEGEVRLIAEQTPGWLVISVEDTGIGIAKENLPKLFDRFFRCADARVQQVEGNGLGLAFTKEVVQLHNGQLTAESELNQGSRFVIRLPVPSDS